MALPVVVVAGPGWDPGGEVRNSLSSSFEIEVFPSNSISMPESRQWGRALGAVFVDRPSLGESTVEVVSALQARLDASIVVLDDDPDPTDIVAAILAGADFYAPRDSLNDLVVRWPHATPEKRSAEEVVRDYAADAIQTVAWVPAIHRAGALSEALLKSIEGDLIARRPLLRKARVSFEHQLLNEFAKDGVGEAPTLLHDQSKGAEPAARLPQLFWNTRFPNDDGILRNKPHIVVAGAEYLLETSLGPEPEPGAETSPQDSAAVVGKEIAFRLEATNGEFRHLDSDEWEMRVISSPAPCSESGTDPFRARYRVGSAGQAMIDAFLLVDNGSVDQQRLVLQAIDGDPAAIEVKPSAQDSAVAARLAGRSVTNAPGADYGLWLREADGDLMHHSNPIIHAKLPEKFAPQVNELAGKLYAQLRDLSRVSRLAGDPVRPLLLQNADDVVLRLAQIGARLHHSVFISPIRPTNGGLPDEMRAIAERLRVVDATVAPPLLQIHARDFPLPWGLLYDGSSDGGKDLKTADDVDPNGFWGRRFDIYRVVVAVAELDPKRGARRLVKPVVGASVPRGQEQRLFLEGLGAKAADKMLEVQEICSSPTELETWAMSGDESDLLYFFCHARPERLDEEGAVVPSALGLGAKESESRADLSQLRNWWPGDRLTNPVVFVNACSSGQQDLIHGAPFVEFFLEQWKAQAFLGTDWPINAGFADVFGQRVLLKLLQEQVSLRTALRTVSDEAARDSNYFPLMYAVYGLNSVQFADPASSA